METTEEKKDIKSMTAEELAAESRLSLKAIRDAMRISGDKIEDLEKLS